MKNKHKLLLGLILVVSFLFRFYKLSKFPVSLTIDEVIIGYDEHSLGKTGKDHWGEKLPLAFKSVGDYKPPVLIYLMVPAIKLFGLNEFGIRFVIALIGSLTVIPVYLLIKQLTKKENVSLWTSFLIAISPWHVHFSRSTFEAILALFFLIVGAYLFVKTINNQGKQLWLSGIFFGLSMYSYHAERVFVPLFLVLLLILYWKQLWQRKKKTISALVISFIFLIPFIMIMASDKGQTRANAQVFFKQFEFASVRLPRLKELDKRVFFKPIPYNQPVQTLSFWANKYLKYTDLSFLFFDGMDYTHDKFPNVGPLLYFGLPFFILGLIELANKEVFKIKKERYLVIGWLLLGPIPASLAIGSQHVLRSLTTLPIPMLIISLGIVRFIKFIKNKTGYYLYLGLFIGSIIVSLIYYADTYFIHYPTHYSHHLMYGMGQAAEYVWKNRQQYDQIIFSREFGITGRNITGIPFAYVLTKGKVPPQKVQLARQQTKSDEDLKIDNITFREVVWLEDSDLDNTLLVGTKWHFPLQNIPNDKIIKQFKLYNGNEMFYLIHTGKSNE